ncbi:DMT family transporter [Halegenticoccus tardaugens]|uniref:DMT family transporter n=1 Tax=Halegenticoccus tardaugens TaxID=2071624 RepID=UPI00100A4E4A|nr:DMT family transporter [Halegenticoccus tardaugens]
MTSLRLISRHRNEALFLTLAVVWGTSFMAIKSGLDVLPPLLFAALRYDVAGLLLLGYAAATAERWRPATADEWRFVAVGGTLLIGVHFALLFTGQQYVTSAMGAIVLSTAPVLTPLFAWVLLSDERVGRAGALGVLFGLIGVSIVADPDPAAVGDQLYGVALLFASAASFAFGAVLVQRMRATLPLAPAQAWMMLLGAAMLHALSPALAEPGLADVAWTPGALVSLAYLAVVAGALGFLIYFDLLERVGAIEISLVNYAVPAVAALAGWLVLGETITATTVVGFVVIFVGFGLLKWERLFPRVVRLQARVSRGKSVENVYVSEGGAFPDSRAGDRVCADD